MQSKAPVSSKETLCDVEFVDRERVERVKASLKPDEVIYQLSDTFSVLADPTRTKILLALDNEELCVCDISNLLCLTQSAVSHQLRVLRNVRLVKYRREGRMAYYTLDDNHIEKLMQIGLEHIEEGH